MLVCGTIPDVNAKAARFYKPEVIALAPRDKWQAQGAVRTAPTGVWRRDKAIAEAKGQRLRLGLQDGS